MDRSKMLPRSASPEAVGVSSAVVARFLHGMEAEGVNIHSFMVLRHGKVAAECYRAPFTAETPHAMYSVSKSFTSTALGIAVGEGLLSPDDKVRDFFPEFTEHRRDKYLDLLTVRHLIGMQSGKNPGILSDKTKGRWIKDFFDAPWTEKPGTKYRYISENTFMVCAILTRVAGMSVIEYLTPRLFEPLGIDVPFWETDNYGVEAGGWGLYVTAEDLMKLMLCYHQGGVYNGKQVIPADWVSLATANLTDNGYNTQPDFRVGYGLGFWQNKDVAGYRADGMFSQFGVVFKDYDAVVVALCGVPLEQAALDFIWRYFPAAFENVPAEPAPADTAAFREKLAAAVLDTPDAPSRSDMQETVDGRTIRFRKKILLNLIGFPMSMLPLAVTFMTTDKAGNINDMRLCFADDTLSLTWTEGDETNTVPCGMNGKYCYGKMRLGGIDYKVCSTAKWTADNRLRVQVRPVTTVGKRILSLEFRPGDKVVMKPSSSPSVPEILPYLQVCFNDTNKFVPLQWAAGQVMRLFPMIVEPTHRGKFID